MTVDLDNTPNKVIVYAEPGTIETEVLEKPIEKPGAGQVLVRILYSGVCHTDYSLCTSSIAMIPPLPKGQVGGHEGIGEVVAQGPGVTYPAIGTKVGLGWVQDACLSCDFCIQGAESSCPSATVNGMFSPGTFQQYYLGSARYVTLLPDGIDLAAAAPLMCGGSTVYAALNRATWKNGDYILVTGAGGGLGHLAIQFAKAMGAKVLAVDARSKEQFCSEVGSDAFIAFDKYDDVGLAEEVKRVSNGGAKVVLECSGSMKAYAQAVTFLGFRGSLVCIGAPHGEMLPIATASPALILGLEATIFGVKAASRSEVREALRIVARGLVKTKYQMKPITGLTEAFEEVKTGNLLGRTVIDLR